MLKEASKDFWIEYGKFKYKNVEIKLSQENRAGLLEKFSEEFKQYVLERANAKNFYKEILNSRIIFRVGDDLCSVCEFSQNINSSRVDMEVIWPIEIADQILTGAINFEASYIGFLGTFSVNPPSLNNGHAVRWLSMFGYVWQRNVTSKDS